MRQHLAGSWSTTTFVCARAAAPAAAARDAFHRQRWSIRHLSLLHRSVAAVCFRAPSAPRPAPPPAPTPASAQQRYISIAPQGMSLREWLNKMKLLRADPEMQKLMLAFSSDAQLQKKCAELVKKMNAQGPKDLSLQYELQEMKNLLEQKGIDAGSLQRLAQMFMTPEGGKPAQPVQLSDEKSGGQTLFQMAKRLLGGK